MTVYRQFRRAFSEDDGWTWGRQDKLRGTGRFGPCSKLRWRSRATIYFRDEEGGEVARIAGQASFFPPALREYLANNVPTDLENGYMDYRIEAEHADKVIDILRG